MPSPPLSEVVNLPAPLVQAALVERARRKLLAGDPLPAIELQWPGTVLDWFQVDLIRSFFSEHSEIFIKGCTSAGKGCATAIATNLWFWLYDPCKVIVTSKGYQHACDVMWSEILRWRKQMRFPGAGEARSPGLFHHEQHKLIVINPDTAEGFSGHHGPHTLFVFDEATKTPDSYYEQALTQARLIVALANPRTLSGWFREAFPKENPNETQTIEGRMGPRRCITISALDCLNVKEGKVLIPDQLTRVDFEGIMKSPIKDFPKIMGLGQFPEEDTALQVVPPSWLARHQEAWHAKKPAVQAFGLDVAASESGDRTVLAAGGAEGLTELHVRQGADTMQTVGWVLERAKSHGINLQAMRVWICVDVDGIGKGVGDRLRELGVRVLEFHGGGTAANHMQYKNRRAEMYGELGHRLNPDGPWLDEAWPMPTDKELVDEFAAHEKVYTSDGLKYGLTPKDRLPGAHYKGKTLREKLGRSPDKSDAVAMLYEAVRFAIRRAPPRIRRALITGDSDLPSDFQEVPIEDAPRNDRLDDYGFERFDSDDDW